MAKSNTCIRCKVWLPESSPIGMLCQGCVHAFAFSRVADGWAYTDRYQLYTCLYSQGMHELAAKVIEDWVGGKDG